MITLFVKHFSLSYNLNILTLIPDIFLKKHFQADDITVILISKEKLLWVVNYTLELKSFNNWTITFTVEAFSKGWKGISAAVYFPHNPHSAFLVSISHPTHCWLFFLV